MNTLPPPAAPLPGSDSRRAARWLLMLGIAAFASQLAHAVDVASAWPAGSINTREQAESAKRAAADELTRIAQTEAQGQAECQRRVLVNDCLASLRDQSEAARRAVRRVELEAKDRIRALDAADAAQRKLATERKNAEQDAERARRAERSASEKSPPVSSPRLTPEQAEANRAAGNQREADLKARQLEAAQRAEQAPARQAEFNTRQAEAEQRAREAAVKRAENQKKRAERAEARRKAEAERAAASRRLEEQTAPR